MGPAPSTVLPTPVDYKGKYDNKLIADLKAKEHELFDAQNAKTSKLGYTGGFVTGLIFDQINKPNVEKFNNLIEADPVKAWEALKKVGATDTFDWQGVLRGKETKGVFDNALTNALASVGSTVQNTTKTVENLAKNVENTSSLLKDLTDPNNAIFLVVGGVIVAYLILKK